MGNGNVKSRLVRSIPMQRKDVPLLEEWGVKNWCKAQGVGLKEECFAPNALCLGPYATC
jgi:hypothetical protein